MWLWLTTLKNLIYRERRVYLDYAAATPVAKRVITAMRPYFSECFANPSSIHIEGVLAKRALDDARKTIARALRAREEEIIFTSGGTESNNLAIYGVVEALKEKDVRYEDIHIITSNVEHVSVLNPVRDLEQRGVSVTHIAVDDEGCVDKKQVLAALTPKTRLLSLMYVNNEIGTITSLRTIAQSTRAFSKQYFNIDLLIHSDASQAPLFLDVSPERLSVDLLTIDAQKIYGPKGIGLLYKRRNVHPMPFLKGGKQEWGLRPGTEALPLIVGLAEALCIVTGDRGSTTTQVQKLQDIFIKELERHIPQATINGSLKKRIPNNVNISIPNTDSEFLVIKLDEKGVAASTASACLGGGGSYVVAELEKRGEQEKDAIRFTLGKETTPQEIRHAVQVLKRCLKTV